MKKKLKKILSHRRRMMKHEIMQTSAAVAFYATLAVIPGITALILGYIIAIDREKLLADLTLSEEMLPSQLTELVTDQIDKILTAPGHTLWIAFLIAFIVAFLSARSGMMTLIHGLNRAADVDEDRSDAVVFFRTLLFTIGAGIFVMSILFIIIGGHAVISLTGVSGTLLTLALTGRWIVLALMILTAISILYRFGPDRPNPQWHLLSTGPLVAMIVWVASSLFLSWYVQTVGSYDQIYGALGSIVILMLWLYISAIVLLAGAEIPVKK
jgi:membrane protein